MTKGLYFAFILLVSLVPTNSIIYRPHSHPVPFYPGLKEPHGGRFKTGPYHQRPDFNNDDSIDSRHRFPVRKRLEFPDFDQNSNELFDIQGEESSTNYIVRDRGQFHRPKYIRRPNPPRRPLFVEPSYYRQQYQKKRRPEVHFQEVYRDRRKHHSRRPIQNRRPLVYETRPPILSYHRPAETTRFKEHGDKEEAVFLKNGVSGDKDQVLFPGQRVVGAHLGVSFRDDNQGIVNDVSDNANGWIPLPSSDKSYFKGVYGHRVQGYKEPSTQIANYYGYLSESASETHKKIDRVNTYETVTETEPYIKYGDPTGHADFPEPSFLNSKFDESLETLQDKEQSKQFIELQQDNNGYSDPTGHGERISEVTSSQFQGDTNNLEDFNYLNSPKTSVSYSVSASSPKDDRSNYPIGYGFSKVIPENRDLSSGADEAMSVVGGRRFQSNTVRRYAP